MVTGNNAQLAWQRAQVALTLQLTASGYDTLVGPCRFFSYGNGALKLLAPNSVARDLLRNRLSPWLKGPLVQLLDGYVDVHLIQDTAVPATAVPTTPLRIDGRASQSSGRTDWIVVPMGGNRLYPAYTFASLIIGPRNRLLCVATKQIVILEASDFASRFIYANTGFGKTHLLHAIHHLALNTLTELKAKSLTKYSVHRLSKNETHNLTRPELTMAESQLRKCPGYRLLVSAIA